jgi:methyl-accepting chemotaxis protein WspA
MIPLRNVSFRIKFAILFFTYAVGLVLVFSIGFYARSQVKVGGPIYKDIRVLQDLTAEVVPPHMNCSQAYVTLLQIRNTDTPESGRKLELAYRRAVESFKEGYQKYLNLDLAPEIHEALQQSQSTGIEFFASADRWIETLRLPPEESAIIMDKLRPELQSAYEAHQADANALLKLLTDAQTTGEEEALVVIESWTTTILTIGTCTLLLTAWIIWQIGSAIIRPTDKLISKMREMAEGAGDLTTRIDVESNDEVGQLASTINTVISKLHDLVAEIKSSSLDLLTTTAQIASTAHQQESTVQSFGASSSEIAAAVRQISATSQELLSTMNKVTTNAEQATLLATSGRTGLASMENTMGRLSDATCSIASKLSAIREKAGDINMVITTITKVADQTNLLSINAAIEAEKAGEFGRGFLVVAREIRRLADQTAVATLDIENLVRHMQSAVSAGVMEMDRFNEEVRGGVSKVAEINSQMGQIIEEVQTLGEQFPPLHEGMRQQSLGARQINEAMATLTGGASQTGNSLRDLNQAAVNLRESVDRLRNSVVRFTVAGQA